MTADSCTLDGTLADYMIATFVNMLSRFLDFVLLGSLTPLLDKSSLARQFFHAGRSIFESGVGVREVGQG